MKFQISLKTPDAVENALTGLNMDEHEQEATKKMCERWFKWGEYLTVEVDTEKQTCVVLNA